MKSGEIIRRCESGRLTEYIYSYRPYITFLFVFHLWLYFTLYINFTTIQM